MDFFAFMLGYVSGVVACTLFTVAVTRRGSRRPKPNSGPPGATTYTDLRTGVTTYLGPGPLVSNHSLRCIATFDGVHCTCRPTTPANITAPKGSCK
jgi:hypothetical protein